MRIERVTEEDADRLLEIYGPYVKETAISFEYEVPSQEEFRDRIRSISSQYPYIKAVDEESAILGYAYAAAFKSRAAYDWGGGDYRLCPAGVPGQRRGPVSV